ncbi:DJ-1/PfpI family protein [uncultured Dokdonia sp.]|uniref:DJ-1/PfpI family protein n=1 Tax=uncultured Dokdonia sp. TaxID=575653 RepID=UPI00261D9EC8|nr:DJ-1/PfpI family protein [uncultured Dokdonia sp.]
MKHLFILIAVLALYSCETKERKQIETEVPNTEITTSNNAFAKAKPELKEGRYNVAFLIMDGTYNTELTAPFDIFQHTQYRENIKQMNVFTVANTLNPIRTFEGMYLLPDFDYTAPDLPNIDILVVPSAEHHLDTDLDDEVMINFVKKVDQNALYMTSHCDGAFVLAKAGLLDGKVSTTFPSDIDKMRDTFPQLDIRKEVLFVHDGKYITSAGGAKSFEAALYLAEHLYGAEIARSLAGGLVIDWKLNEVPHLIVE